MGYRHLALTDVENVYGQVQFHAACRAQGVTPITGVELSVPIAPGARAGRVVLLAPTERAYADLCRIVSQRRTSGTDRAAPLDTCGAQSGAALWLSEEPLLLRELARREGPAHVRALVVRPRPIRAEGELIGTARELGVALVASLDVVSLDGRDRALRRLALAISLGRREAEVPWELVAPGGTLLAPDAAAALFSDLPEAVRETSSIAEGCTLDLLELARPRPRRPELRHELERRCLEQLGSRDPAGASTAQQERLRAELDVIEALGLADPFASVAALVAIARELGISISARGSVVSSLVGHLLGLSPIDPIEQGLYFERFASEARRSPPDIDLDVASRRRDELVDRFISWRGHDRTVRVSSLQSFKRRSAHRAGLRALGAPREVIARFLAHLPPDELGEAAASRPLYQRHLPLPWRTELGRIESLIGLPRQLARHPGGVVLGHVPIEAVLPLERTPSGATATQYDAESLAKLGFVKVDLLGSHCLDELDEIERARRLRGAPAFELTDIPLDDPATLESIDRADTLGCHQLESPAQRAVLARLPIRRLDDITHALAIVRPGPASGRAKELFLARARGEASEPELHPLLAARLASSHGLLLFEEDILFLLAQFAGLPLPVAEALRVRLQERADDHAWLARARRRFLARAEQRGFSTGVADGVWSDVLRFVNYSFNKAHAVSQARLAYQSAFLKCHAPLEHGAALLNHHAGLYPRRVIAADLARRGIRLLLPSLCRSGIACSLEPCERTDTGSEGAAIRIGLALIKGVRDATRRHILAAREPELLGSLADALASVGVRAAEWRAFVRVGACDELFGLRDVDYPWVHEAVLAHLVATPTFASAHASLEEVIVRARERLPHEPGDVVERYRALCRVQNELEYLEMHVSHHPMRILRGEAARLGCIASDELSEHVGHDVAFAAVVAASRRVPLARSGVTQFLTLEDEQGLVEARLSPVTYARLAGRISTPGPFLVRARVCEQRGALYLAIDELIAFHQRPPPPGRS